MADAASSVTAAPPPAAPPEAAAPAAAGVWLYRLAPVLALVVGLSRWEAGCRLAKIPVYVLPPPSAILSAATGVAPLDWLGHAWATLQVALLGYAVSVLLSLPLAMAITGSKLLSRTLVPWLVVIQSTPIVAIAPIIVVTLGAGVLPRVVITMLISFFPMVIATATGLAAAPPELIELSRSLRASRGREYTQIRMPYAVPYIFGALKVSTTLSVVGAVVAEFVAAERGLGYLILFSTSSFKVPVAFAALAILVCCSLLFFAIITALQGRLFPWSVTPQA